jgi:hypothetical protein
MLVARNAPDRAGWRNAAAHEGNHAVYTKVPDFRQWIYDTARGGSAQ